MNMYAGVGVVETFHIEDKDWGGGYYVNFFRSVIIRNLQHCQNTR